MITWTVQGQRDLDPSCLRECNEEKQVNRALGKNYMRDDIGRIESSPALSGDWEQLAVNLIKN